MKIAPVADVKARLSSYLEMCVEEPIIVTKNGRPTAVLVSVTDETELERLVLAHTPRFMRLFGGQSTPNKKGKGSEAGRLLEESSTRKKVPSPVTAQTGFLYAQMPQRATRKRRIVVVQTQSLALARLPTLPA